MDTSPWTRQQIDNSLHLSQKNTPIEGATSFSYPNTSSHCHRTRSAIKSTLPISLIHAIAPENESTCLHSLCPSQQRCQYQTSPPLKRNRPSRSPNHTENSHLGNSNSINLEARTKTNRRSSAPIPPTIFSTSKGTAAATSGSGSHAFAFSYKCAQVHAI